MALREVLARFGIQVDSRQLNQANAGINQTIGALKAMGAAFVATALVNGVRDLVTDIARVGDEIGKTSAQLGIGVHDLQQWREAAQLSGASAKELTTGILTLSKNALTAQQSATGTAAKAFEQLGISHETASGGLKDSATLLRETGLALAGVKTNSERAALAQQLFGKAGVKLLPLFAQGEEGLTKLLGKLDEFGGGLSVQAIKEAEAITDAFKNWDTATTSLKSTFAVAVLPLLTQVITGLARFGSTIGKILSKSSALQTAMLALGAALAKVAFAKLASVGLKALFSIARAVAVPLLKFALMFLVVEDLLTLFRGGDSVIGRFFDKLAGGEGKAQKFVEVVKGIGGAVGGLVTSGDFDQFSKDLDAVFASRSGADILADVTFTFSMIKEVIDAAVDGIGEAVDDFFAEAKTLGDAVIDGIVDGIKSGASKAVNAITEVGKSVIAGAKSVFQSNSPSKVMIDEGGNVTSGLALGMKRMANKVAGVGQSALASVAGLQGGGLSLPGSGPVPGPTSASASMSNSTTINITGGVNDGTINKLRQTINRSNDDNRRATLAALKQVAV